MVELQRRLGVSGAVVIGLTAMLGAGVFFVWTPAASLAGQWLGVALVLAAIVATANALSTAQLAMEHPVAGGGYAYGRGEVSPTVGFAAGWLFLTGKTCSAAAIALVAGAHLLPGLERWVAVAAIVVLAVLNASGVRTTAWVSTGILALVLAGLATALVWHAVGAPSGADGAGWVASAPLSGSILCPGATVDGDFGYVGGPPPEGCGPTFGGELAGPYSVLQAAGLLFFAFAGYARMATLGEEARDPRRTLPLAILAGLGIVLVLYGLIAWAVSHAFAAAPWLPETPVAALVGDPIVHRVLLVLGGLACLGSLMGILAGLSRTSLAMARDAELPGLLAHLSRRTHAPAFAELVMAALAIVLVLVAPPTVLVALSSTAVLAYYGIGHVAALRLRARGAGWLPRWVSVAGLALCALLVVTLPWLGVVGMTVWLALALAVRALAARR